MHLNFGSIHLSDYNYMTLSKTESLIVPPVFKFFNFRTIRLHLMTNGALMSHSHDSQLSHDVLMI